jgi:hypothetical protein
MRQRAPIGLLVLALAASGTLLLSLASNLSFAGDGWQLLAGRPDWAAGTFLQPFNEHPIVLPALVYKVLLTLFGMDSAFPFYAVSISLFLFCAVLLFIYMRQRVGDWSALVGAVLVLFLGAAYEDLLWEFQMGFFGSIAAGLGTLLVLDREDQVGDRVASALLLVSTACSTLGIPFVFAAFAKVTLGPSPRWRRAYVPLLPLAVYAIWWLGSGHSAGSEIGLEDVPDLPRYVFDAAAAGIASLLGREPIEGSGHPPMLAQLLAVILAASLVYWISRRREVPSGLIVALVLTFVFWGLLGLDRGPQRFSSRFQFPSAVFLLILGTEVLRGQRLPRLAMLALVAITAGSVVGGISLLKSGYATWKPRGDEIRATLAAIDIAGAAADPGYSISLPPSMAVRVGQYRDAKRRHGTPAYSEAQLLSASEGQKQLADRTLAATIGLRLQARPEARQSLRCRELDPAEGTYAEARLSSAGSFRLENRADRMVTIGAARFSHTSAAPLGYLPAQASRSLHLPPDRSARPWRLRVDDGPVRLCVVR